MQLRRPSSSPLSLHFPAIAWTMQWRQGQRLLRKYALQWQTQTAPLLLTGCTMPMYPTVHARPTARACVRGHSQSMYRQRLMSGIRHWLLLTQKRQRALHRNQWPGERRMAMSTRMLAIRTKRSDPTSQPARDGMPATSEPDAMAPVGAPEGSLAHTAVPARGLEEPMDMEYDDQQQLTRQPMRVKIKLGSTVGQRSSSISG